MDFNKTYSPSEEIKRKNIFMENLGTLRYHNLKHITGLDSFQLGLNDLSDISFQEFRNVQSPEDYKDIKANESSSFDVSKIIVSDFEEEKIKVPKQFDWRDHIKMASVKNQKSCGSCYAFAVVGAIESFISMETGYLVELSVQEIIDCAKLYSGYIKGCKGGSELAVLRYIMDHGLSYEKDYPFTEKEGLCRKNETHERYQANFTNLITVRGNDEESLVKQLLLYGPTLISIDHLHESFMRYSKGIYYEPDCSSDYEETSHTALLVGYGSENGKDYWIVRNSFGKSWGEEGYFRIARNKNNHCLIASFAFSLYAHENTINKFL